MDSSKKKNKIDINYYRYNEFVPKYELFRNIKVNKCTKYYILPINFNGNI